MAGLDDLPTGAAKAARVRSMFDAIAPRYDLLNRILTFGMDVGWRRLAVASLNLGPGDLVLDVACGTGDVCSALVSAGYRAVGFDFSAGMLAEARAPAPLVQADALVLPVRNRAARGVTCGFALRNVADLGRLFDEFARVLGSGGRLAVIETDEPRSRLLRVGHYAYFRGCVPVIGGLLSDRSAYRWLPRSSAYLPAPAALVTMLERRGFSDVRRRVLGLGAAQLLTGTRA
jgi:demethylmenaquinone methyltransferase/2-methoxy-6-polyprenyl-1,4-benzoquinol methylase